MTTTNNATLEALNKLADATPMIGLVVNECDDRPGYYRIADDYWIGDIITAAEARRRLRAAAKCDSVEEAWKRL